MSYANAIRDIAPGSIWLGAEAMATVICAAAGHVVARLAGRLDTLPEARFRATFEPTYDREQVRQQFTMSLANLGEFRVYWVPSHRRVLMRSISCRRQFRVPDGATLVGTYGEPCAPAVLFRDLDKMLAPHAPERQEAGVGSGAKAGADLTTATAEQAVATLTEPAHTYARGRPHPWSAYFPAKRRAS